VFLPVTVDKIDQDERIVNNDSRECQETDQSDEGQGVIADKEPYHYAQARKGDGDHNDKRLGKGVELERKDEKYKEDGEHARVPQLHE